MGKKKCKTGTNKKMNTSTASATVEVQRLDPDEALPTTADLAQPSTEDTVAVPDSVDSTVELKKLFLELKKIKGLSLNYWSQVTGYELAKLPIKLMSPVEQYTYETNLLFESTINNRLILELDESGKPIGTVSYDVVISIVNPKYQKILKDVWIKDDRLQPESKSDSSDYSSDDSDIYDGDMDIYHLERFLDRSLFRHLPSELDEVNCRKHGSKGIWCTACHGDVDEMGISDLSSLLFKQLDFSTIPEESIRYIKKTVRPIDWYDRARLNGMLRSLQEQHDRAVTIQNDIDNLEDRITTAVNALIQRMRQDAERNQITLQDSLYQFGGTTDNILKVITTFREQIQRIDDENERQRILAQQRQIAQELATIEAEQMRIDAHREQILRRANQL